MSTVFVQLGQCGTQLGHQLIDTIYQDSSEAPSGFSLSQNDKYRQASLGSYFHETESGQLCSRAVTIDMEPKVVQWALDSTKGKGWKYPKGSQLCQSSGSGNNWAYGFHSHGPRCKEKILNLLQKESEKCDSLSGFFIMMSLAGGTGSGVGSYVLQMLQDYFPRSTSLNCIVMPYTSGEVAVQNYNALLTLSCVLSNASAAILVHNDSLHDICTKSLSNKNVSINDLNVVAANQLASTLQPTYHPLDEKTLALPGKSKDVLFDIVRSTSCHSHYKLLSLKSLPHIAEQSIPFSTFQWHVLLKRLKQMHLTNSCSDEGLDWSRSVRGGDTKSLGNLLFLRGSEVTGLDNAAFSGFRDPNLYTGWIPPEERCRIWSTTRPFRKYEKSVSLLSNNSACISGLDSVTKKAWHMYGAKAYLHQYAKHGLEEEDFLNSFVNVENVLNSYLNLS